MSELERLTFVSPALACLPPLDCQHPSSMSMRQRGNNTQKEKPGLGESWDEGARLPTQNILKLIDNSPSALTRQRVIYSFKFIP